MNKVMVTGLGIGKDLGACDICSFDINWLIKNPSTLLWADKIILTPAMWEYITQRNEFVPTEYYNSILMIFQMAKNENILEIKDPKNVISAFDADVIDNQIDKDIINLKESFTNSIRINPAKKLKNGQTSPEELLIGDYEYCRTHLFTIYSSLILSRAWNAQCLFGNKAFEFCKYKFGLDSYKSRNITDAFTTIFNTIMPNDGIFPEIAQINKKHCKECAKENNCKTNYLVELEKDLTELFKWRSYDEILQIKAIIEDITIEALSNQEELDYTDIAKRFHEKEDRTEKIIRRVFPKVQRFANLSTLISLPFAVIGLSTNSSLLTIGGATTAALAQGGKEVIELMKSRNSWVGFLQNNKIGI